jgi:hypothetical protein
VVLAQNLFVLEEVMKFTVVESKWLRGGKGGPLSMLLNNRGDQCCMGFFAEACGVPRSALLESCYFSSKAVVPHYDLIPEPLRPQGDIRVHGDVALKIYLTNDDIRISDEERKQNLTALFAEAGIEVDFVP